MRYNAANQGRYNNMTMPRKEIKTWFAGILDQACLGNPDAHAFMIDAFRVAHIWDDLIDRDVPVANDAINEAFHAALVSLPRNPFYRANMHRLVNFIERSLIDWTVANKWEAAPGAMSRQQAEIAYITRSSYTQLIIEVALIVGGFPHAMCIQEMVRLEMHDEGVDGYLASIGQGE
jgi:hypothetical protein